MLFNVNSNWIWNKTKWFVFIESISSVHRGPLVSTDNTAGEHLCLKSVTRECRFTCYCCSWCLNIAHVTAADVFAVCGWVFRAAPNDPTHTSPEETAVTERVPAEPSPFPLNCKSGLPCAQRRLVKEPWHNPPTCKSLMATINTSSCLWLHSYVVLQHNKSVYRAERCLTSQRR